MRVGVGLRTEVIFVGGIIGLNSVLNVFLAFSTLILVAVLLEFVEKIIIFLIRVVVKVGCPFFRTFCFENYGGRAFLGSDQP